MLMALNYLVTVQTKPTVDTEKNHSFIELMQENIFS